MRAAPTRGEWPLVVFTVLSQAAAGTALAGALIPAAGGARAGWIALALLAAGALAALTHLRRPLAARFVLANLGSSWLSREAALGALFAASLAASAAVPALAPFAAAAGFVFVLAVARLYMLRTVPAWSSWTTPAAFLLTALLLGAATAAVLAAHAGAGAAPLRIGVAVLAGLRLLLAAGTVRRAPGHADLKLHRFLAGLTGAAIVLVAAEPIPLLVAWVLLVAAELMDRRLFYASHRRVGL